MDTCWKTELLPPHRRAGAESPRERAPDFQKSSAEFFSAGSTFFRRSCSTSGRWVRRRPSGLPEADLRCSFGQWTVVAWPKMNQDFFLKGNALSRTGVRSRDLFCLTLPTELTVAPQKWRRLKVWQGWGANLGPFCIFSFTLPLS
jgi:hypothetical protein